jgi:hypothetical protein
MNSAVPIDGKAAGLSGGDLSWYRHIGRADGSFAWEGPKKVGNGWGEFTRTFPGDDGVIYAITPMKQANVQIEGKTPPAEGGDLLWYRHTGHDDGTAGWDEPKKVGTGWGEFLQVFSGGNGVIYAVQRNGDLTWYRHIGRADGSFAWEGPKKVGTGWGEFTHVLHGGQPSIGNVTDEITRFYVDNLGVLTVGTPTGPVIRTPDDGYRQTYTFGNILKPLGDFPDIGDRTHVTISLAGIQCVVTDDPSGTDEPFVVTSVFTLDPRLFEKAVQTRRIGPERVGDVHEGGVFGQGRDMAVDFAIPGDSSIAVHLELFDQELVSNPDKAKEAISDANTAAVLAGVAALTAFVPPAGAAAAAAVAVLQASGLLDDFSDGIGSLVTSLFSEDHLGTVDLRVTKEFLKQLQENPQSLERKSDSIGGESYNFPQAPEDDSPAGKSWLINNGQGIYRPFFRIQLTEP